MIIFFFFVQLGLLIKEQKSLDNVFRYPVLKCGPNTELVLGKTSMSWDVSIEDIYSEEFTTSFTHLSVFRLALWRTAAFSWCVNCVNAFWPLFPSVRAHKSKSQHCWKTLNNAPDDTIQVNSMRKAKAAVVISESCLWHRLDSLLDFIGSCWVGAELEVGHPQRHVHLFFSSCLEACQAWRQEVWQ